MNIHYLDIDLLNVGLMIGEPLAIKQKWVKDFAEKIGINYQYLMELADEAKQEKAEWILGLVTAMSNVLSKCVSRSEQYADVRKADTKAWSRWLNGNSKLPATSHDTWMAACAYKEQEICLSDIEQQNYDLRAELETLKEKLKTLTG